MKANLTEEIHLENNVNTVYFIATVIHLESQHKKLSEGIHTLHITYIKGNNVLVLALNLNINAKLRTMISFG